MKLIKSKNLHKNMYFPEDLITFQNSSYSNIKNTIDRTTKHNNIKTRNKNFSAKNRETK